MRPVVTNWNRILHSAAKQLFSSTPILSKTTKTPLSSTLINHKARLHGHSSGTVRRRSFAASGLHQKQQRCILCTFGGAGRTSQLRHQPRQQTLSAGSPTGLSSIFIRKRASCWCSENILALMQQLPGVKYTQQLLPSTQINTSSRKHKQ